MQLKQISVFLENKSGRLSRVTQILKEADIDILALCVADSNEYGILRMIVDKPAKAMEELEKAKFTVSLTKVIGVAIPDNAGGLSTVIELLAKQHISMEYIYAFTSRKIGEAIITAIFMSRQMICKSKNIRLKIWLVFIQKTVNLLCLQCVYSTRAKRIW